jgi:hypothetical protein
VLIAPEWILTAPHVVRNKIENPGAVNVRVCFGSRGERMSAMVVESFLDTWDSCGTWENWRAYVRYEWVRVALARLDRSIDTIPPAVLAADPLPPGTPIQINIVGTTIRDDPVLGAQCTLDPNRDRPRLIREAVHTARSERKRANPCDSGGVWLFERQGHPDVVVGILQGHETVNNGAEIGVAAQPTVSRGWIDEKLRESGAAAKWIRVAY